VALGVPCAVPSSLIIPLPVEPSVLGVGLYHAAVCVNNRALFYELGDMRYTPIGDRSYPGEIDVSLA